MRQYTLRLTTNSKMSFTKRRLRYCQKQKAPHYCFFIVFTIEGEKNSQVCSSCTKIKWTKHIIYETTQSPLEKDNWEPWDKFLLGDKDVILDKACSISASSEFFPPSPNKLQLKAFSWVNEGKLHVPLSQGIKKVISSSQKTHPFLKLIFSESDSYTKIKRP